MLSILYNSKAQAEKDAELMRICFRNSHAEINEVTVDE